MSRYAGLKGCGIDGRYEHSDRQLQEPPFSSDDLHLCGRKFGLAYARQLRRKHPSRRDIWDRFAGIAVAAREFSPRTLILDGEAVVLDEQGRSSFSALQTVLGGRGGKRNAGEAIFYAFDLLYLDGYDLTKLSQYERRQMLQDLLEGQEGAIRLSETIEADGEELLKHACELGLEGIIAKHEDRPYRSGPDRRLAQDQMHPERQLRCCGL